MFQYVLEVGVVRDLDVLHAVSSIVSARSARRIVPAPTASSLSSARNGSPLAYICSARWRARAIERSPTPCRRQPHIPPSLSKPALPPSIRQFACCHLVNKPWKKLRVVARSITHESTDEDLHAVRIMAKRCRYCADTAAMVCGSDAARFAQASKCAGSPGQLPRHRHHRTVAAPSSANNTRCRTNGGPAHRRAEE